MIKLEDIKVDSPFQERNMGHIKSVGWACVATNDDHTHFCYTIGLEVTHDHPEIIIVGLRPDKGHAILSEVVEEIKGGARFDLERATYEGAGGYRAIFKEMPEKVKKEYACQAGFLYDQPFRLLQLIFPDRDGNYPTDEGAVSEAFLKAQPVLG